MMKKKKEEPVAEPVADDEGFESSPEKVSPRAYSVFAGLIAVFASAPRHSGPPAA